MQVQCPKHDGSYIIFILQKENEIEFICDQCQTNMQDQNKWCNYQRLINIKKAIKQPEYLISKIINSNILKDFFKELYEQDENNLSQQLKDIDNIIEELQIQLSNVRKELQVYTKKYLEIRQQIRDNLVQVINFEQFKQYFSSLNQLEKSIKPQDISENEKNIHSYFENLCKTNFLNINNQIFNFLKQKQQQINYPKIDYPELRNLQQLYQQLQILHTSFSNKISPRFPGIIDNTEIITKEFQAKLIETILKKHKENQLKLTQFIKDQVDGKNNLLMVFQSQNGNIFGAFSPCQWVKSKKGEFLNDETRSSFLFSQTNNKIFSIKQDYYASAIYCNVQYGPVFGGKSSLLHYFSNKCDLMIFSDFQNGSSNLGIAYQDSNDISKTNSETLMFGQLRPNIVFYEIFQVSFS